MAMRPAASLLLLLTPFAIAVPHPELGDRYAPPAEVGRELVGTRPSEWALTDWQNSRLLTLAGLRGKVVLIRWWTAPDCSYCSASADALNRFAARYRERGLVVIGAYHHKEDTPLTPEHVATQAKRLGLTFPVAIDRDWKTLNAWWLEKTKRGWTSVTFLVGRDGRIAHVHGGGAYFEGEPGYAALEKAIEAAVQQPTQK
jgi:peroxiredoxin